MADETKTLGMIGVSPDGTASAREPVFVRLSSYKNSRYLDLRKFYDKDGQWLPGSKGITLHAEQFSELLQILTDHKEEILDWTKKE